jgi:hypothetical protein
MEEQHKLFADPIFVQRNIPLPHCQHLAGERSPECFFYSNGDPRRRYFARRDCIFRLHGDHSTSQDHAGAVCEGFGIR